MKYLITGGLGFMGSNLAHLLVKEGHEVRILDNNSHWLGANTFNVEGLDVEVRLGDIRESHTVRDAIEGVDGVFSLAAQKDHARSMRRPFEDIDINCRGIMNILIEVKKSKRPIRVIFPGTTTQLTYPIDIYSANKDVGEKYHIMFNKRYNLSTSVIRFPNLYGPRARITDMAGGVVNYFIGLALQNKKIPVYVPSQVKTMIYIEDVAKMLYNVMQKDDCIVYEATSSSIDLLEKFAKKIIEEVGSGTYREIEWPDTTNKLIDYQDIRTHLLMGQTKFEDGLKKTVKFYKENYDKYL